MLGLYIVPDGVRCLKSCDRKGPEAVGTGLLVIPASFAACAIAVFLSTSGS